jgi:hypothetical protein
MGMNYLGLTESFMDTYRFLVEHGYGVCSSINPGKFQVSYPADDIGMPFTVFAQLDSDGVMSLSNPVTVHRSQRTANAIEALRKDVTGAGLHYDAHGRTAFHCEGLF